MSPDNHYSNPVIKRLIDASTSFGLAFPNLARYMLADDGAFRGMTMFIGDSADFVVGLRGFGDDGTPVVLWSSGGTVLEALVNLDRATNAQNFKVDTKAVNA